MPRMAQDRAWIIAYNGPMARTSAGLLPYRFDDDGTLLVFIAHMGGPLWARRDAGGWSLAKGEYDAGTQQPKQVAATEFAEEIGVAAPSGPWLELGVFWMPSGKRVTTYAVHAPATLAFVASNTFEMEWPRGSGRRQQFPEIDAARWFPIEVAATKVVAGQVPILHALTERLRDADGDTRLSPTC